MNNVEKEYFNWLYTLMCGNDTFKANSFSALLSRLYDREFTWIICNDSNRAEEGINLRYRFAMDRHYRYSGVKIAIKGPCNMLEMIAALAIRCEENIMDDPLIGDRTTQWFWSMINSLGLSTMYGNMFDPDYIDDVLTKFMNRDYSPNGKGGLFTIKNYTTDLRSAEIWYQLCCYLDNLEGY